MESLKQDMKVVFLTSASCGPCKRLKPLMQEVAAETGLSFEQHEYAPGEENYYFTKFGVRSVPVIALVDRSDDTELARINGGQTKEALLKTFKEWGVI
ncbi:thioredoxin family protein [Acinetobacter brisouii]|uniref:thioredoxin family protein n=1 Tax=Acinetobacter brisouii TaxID=396323 RepID=UPI00124F47C1|nr:thioredoxin family protein [Acinetobacter brisouii]